MGRTLAEFKLANKGKSFYNFPIRGISDYHQEVEYDGRLFEICWNPFHGNVQVCEILKGEGFNRFWSLLFYTEPETEQGFSDIKHIEETGYEAFVKFLCHTKNLN